MGKIIFVRHESLSSHIFSFFSIGELLEKNYKVEYWDISQICFPGMELLNELSHPIVHKIPDVIILEKMLAESKEGDIFLVDVLFNLKNINVYRTFSRFDYIYIHLDLFSDAILPISKWRYLELSFSSIIGFCKKIINFIGVRFYKKIFKLDIFKGHFSSLSLHENEIGHFFLNHPDYDLWLKKQESLLITDEKFVVFLDEFFPLHPDLLHLLQVDLSVETSSYRNSLSSFFSKLEEEVGMKVVIAAHPKSNYTIDDFDGRKIVYGKTMELVQQSSLVLTHGSSSVNFAVLTNKPIVFLYNDLYKSLRFLFLTVCYRAQILDAALINIDNVESSILSDFSRINQTKYMDFRYYCLTSKNTEGRSNDQLMEEYIKIIMSKLS